MSTKRFAVWLFPLLATVLLIPGIAHADDALRERMENLRDTRNPMVGGVRLASARVLSDFYGQRDNGFAWNSSGQVEDLIRLAERSKEDGLQPSDFNSAEVQTLVGGGDPSLLSDASRVDADILLSDSLLRLIHHHRYGKVDPQTLDRKWNHADGPKSTDLVRDLQNLVTAADLEAGLQDLTSRPVFYTQLKEGLARYRAIAAAGGWPSVPPGRNLKSGMSSARAPIVRERLRVTGEYESADPANSRLYDKDLEHAIISFQKRHHLATDGVIGPATLAAMNVPVQQRVDQIRINLERMRWVYDELPDDFLLVDISGQEVQLLRGGDVVWRSRIIVGRQERPTPVFRDQVEYLEFNPTWTVPPTILKKDILPNARKNPSYVSKKGLKVITRDGKSVSPGSVNWHAPASNFPYMLRQPPGNKNALGRVKFMFPNRYSVYLHDTPSRNLFSKPKRLYSSGCVRVERPMELAELVLNNPKRWNQEKFEQILKSNRTRWVHLEEPLQIILAYWTAEVGEDGEVGFREDIYSRDDAVLGALNGNGRLRIQYVDAPPPESVASVASGPAAATALETDPGTTTAARDRSTTLPEGGPLVRF
ncbi:MAG: L,D-transpeptidase family protein [Pseudomonadota bacterium]|nr:L,D-transpeptidase family protein [Pseudomonadota bacterium]